MTGAGGFETRPYNSHARCSKKGPVAMKNDMQPLSPDAANLEPPQGGLQSYPPSDRWSDWTEYDAAAWPRRVEKHYDLIPTICFNCEAGCGLLAYVDKETQKIRKFEGNPEHPGSRGRNCAKGPATINQVNDPERILYPMKRAGKRGGGQWERVTWDEVLDDLAGRNPEGPRGRPPQRDHVPRGAPRT